MEKHKMIGSVGRGKANLYFKNLRYKLHLNLSKIWLDTWTLCFYNLIDSEYLMFTDPCLVVDFKYYICISVPGIQFFAIS